MALTRPIVVDTNLDSSKSDCQPQVRVDLPEPAFDLFVAFESQGVYPSSPHQASGSDEELESEGPRRLQGPSCGALQGSVSLRESGFDLEVGQEVVGEQDELLPGAVGLAVLRGDGVEGQVALEFSYGLLVQSPAAHEAPEGAQGQVGGHGAVLEGAVAGVEEVELVVLSGGVHDLLPEDDRPESALPFLDGDGGGEGPGPLLDPAPSALPGDLSLQVQPLPEGHLDGVGRLVFVDHIEHALVEEGAVHAESQPVGAQPPDPSSHHVGVEPLERFFGGRGETLEKATGAAVRRQVFQRAEPLHQEIAPQEAQVTKATPAQKEQAQDGLAHARRAVIAARHPSTQAPTQLISPSDHAQIPYHQFQSAIGGQAFGGEIDLQIAIDARVQILFLSSHWQGPFFFG